MKQTLSSIRVSARHRRPVGVGIAWLMAVALLLGLPRSMAQEARFHGSIEVTSVSLEVTVTRKGKPVTDLTREDFQIFEDGEERPITGFSRITGGLVAPAREAAPAAGKERPSPSTVRPHVVLLFDVNGASLPVLTRAVRAATRWVERHHTDGTLWAVAAVGTEPHLLLPYTGDLGEVRTAIASVTGVQSARDLTRLDSSLLSDTIRYQPTSLLGDDLGNTNTGNRLSVEQLADLAAWQEGKNQLARVGLLGRGLTEILRGSASIRGPKACLLFSGNIDLSPAFSDTYAASTSHAPFSHRRMGDTIEIQRQLQELTHGIAQLAASTGFRIYPIAMEGLRPSSDTIDVSRGGSTDLRDETSGPTSLNPRSPSADWDALPLTLAEVTGGRSIRRNDIASSLDEAAASLDSFYILGFESPRKASGVWRTIRVKVRRPGVRVEYRRGRYDLDREQILAEQLTAPRLLTAGAGDFPVELRAVSQDSSGGHRVTATVTTALEHLAFLPNGETWVAQLGLLAAVYDARGRFLALHRGRQTVKIPAALWESVRSRKARFALSFEPPPGARQVTMALFDRSAETWGLATAAIVPGTPEKTGLVNAIPEGIALPVLHRLPSPALQPAGAASGEARGEAPAKTPVPERVTPLERWAQGPVRWLLTADERKELPGRRTEAASGQWIRLFWARRDPNPATAANPFKVTFEERVRMADELLAEPGLRGSLTDRGHVLVLLGKPRSRRKSSDLRVDTWFYRRKDLVRGAHGLRLPPVIRFQFRLNDEGHYRLHDEVPAKQREAEELLRRYPAALILNPHLTVAPVPPLYAGVPAASHQELEELVSSREEWPSGGLIATYPETFPGRALRWWVVVNLPRTLDKPQAAVGLVLDQEHTAVGSFHLDLTPTAGDSGWSFDLSLPVPDTRSTLMFEILSRSGPVASKVLTLRVPVAPPQATVITPAIFGTDIEKIGQYHPWTTNLFGGYHLNPRPDGRFRMGQTVYFFFNVIHPGRPENGLPCVEAELRLLRGETAVAAAHWPCHELSMMSAGTYLFGSSFTLSGLDPPGQYSLELTIREPVSGAVQITSRPITVEP